MEFYVSSLTKYLSKIKVNNDIYRHTDAERLHHQEIHTTRNVKGVLQEEGNSHQIEFWVYIKE